MKQMMLALLVTLSAAAAVAQQPDPALRQLDFLNGKWQCKGIAYANPMSPEHATRGEVEQRWTLDGRWLQFSYTEKKTAANPMPFAVSGFFGYDAELKKYVIGTVDNMGGYSVSAADGWNGDSIVFAGPWHMGTMTMNGRDTFMKHGPNELMHTAEIEQNGTWMKAGQETCTRVRK